MVYSSDCDEYDDELTAKLNQQAQLTHNSNINYNLINQMPTNLRSDNEDIDSDTSSTTTDGETSTTCTWTSNKFKDW